MIKEQFREVPDLAQRKGIVSRSDALAGKFLRKIPLGKGMPERIAYDTVVLQMLEFRVLSCLALCGIKQY